MKALVKPPFERMLAARWIGSVTKQRVRNKRLVLAYHGIIPDDAPLAGEQSLFIRRAEFAAQLDLINSVADVAPLHRLDEQGDGRPRVAISFDDAYYGAVSDGIDELVQRKLPVTIFVAPGRLGGSVFWWDALADHTGYLDERTRTYALETLNGAHEKVRSWAKANEMHWTEDLPAYAKASTLDYLREAVKRPGVTVGSHSWSHRNLATLTAVIILVALNLLGYLEARFGLKPITVSYEVTGKSAPEILDELNRVFGETHHFMHGLQIARSEDLSRVVFDLTCTLPEHRALETKMKMQRGIESVATFAKSEEE